MDGKDDKGRFQKGHGGFKPKGAKHKVTLETKEILLDAISGITPQVQEKFDAIKDPGEWLRCYKDLVGYILPKQKEIEVTSNEKRGFDFSKLTPDQLAELIQLMATGSVADESEG